MLRKNPENSKITFKNKQIFKILKNKNEVIHAVLIATKPDIIKQAPLILKLREKGETVLVIHSGQHYDWNLSGGMEQEFNILPDVNLNIRGVLYEQQAQIIARFGFILAELKKINKKVIPYIYGDTTTAVAGGVASFANMFGTAHVEAGLRTMNPPEKIILGLKGNFDVPEYFERLRAIEGWKKGSYEPYPEQFDTRAAAPSAGIHFAPTDLNKLHLKDEGFEANRIFVVGNPVADALALVEDKIDYKLLSERLPFIQKDDLIRICIHRRENITSYHRFKAIMEAIFDLAYEGRNILLISLKGTQNALKNFRLDKKLKDLTKSCKNFVCCPVFPYYRDVVGIMKKCSLIVTDSGSIQEETNMLGIPGAILRFNTDRPEAVIKGSNILVPPINKKIITRIIRHVADNKKTNAQMRRAPKLYGKNVADKMINYVNLTTKNKTLFELLEHHRLGLSKKNFWIKGSTHW
ncbi:MAG: UDP-N-acetylglucosamine 2-epimerase [Candidatus Omnitrophica bacterium]|nr:UDP-N-acetylglucosamine 2-epimerase [Candidatus Omnitrophota bacterium]